MKRKKNIFYELGYMRHFNGVVYKIHVAALFFCIFPFPVVAKGENTPTADSAKDHAVRGDSYVVEGKLFHAVVAYRHALAAGMHDPEILRNLSLTLYDLRLVDEAVESMEKAVALAKGKDLFHMELGILYLVKDRLDKAEEEFLAALKINPGLTDAYYYLGKLYFRQKKYQAAWYAAKVAKKLGHPDEEFIIRLAAVAPEPTIFPWSNSDGKLLFRQIVTASREEAEGIVQRIHHGEYFEDIAADEFGGASEHNGGVMGTFRPEELSSELSKVLLDNDVFSGPYVVAWKDAFLVVQRLGHMDLAGWKTFSPEIQSARKQEEKTTTPRRTSQNNESREVSVTEKIDKEKVRVYVAAYPSERFSVVMAKKLKEQGFPAYVLVDARRDGKILYNAMAGEYSDRGEAERVRDELKKTGHNAFLSAP